MAEFPAMPLWTDAYLGDTRHLSTIQHGAYLLLLLVSWRNGGDLPDDDRLLARYAGLSRAQWGRMAPDIRSFFRAENGRIYQPRLRDEFNAVKRKRESQAANGRASALKNKARHATKRQPNTNGTSTPLTLPLTSEPNGSIELPNGSSPETPELKPEHIFESFNEMAASLGRPTIRELTPERRQLIRARIAQYPIADFQAVFDRCNASAFLRGDKGRTPLTFDWLFKKANFQKVLEGNYE